MRRLSELRPSISNCTCAHTHAHTRTHAHTHTHTHTRTHAHTHTCTHTFSHAYSSPLPGDYGVKLHFAKCGTNTPWTFSEALNTLFIKPGDDFAVTFKFATPPPPQCFVRAMVCYGDPVHIQKLGVVTVTPHRDKSDKGGKLGNTAVLAVCLYTHSMLLHVYGC